MLDAAVWRHNTADPWAGLGCLRTALCVDLEFKYGVVNALLGKEWLVYRSWLLLLFG